MNPKTQISDRRDRIFRDLTQFWGAFTDEQRDLLSATVGITETVGDMGDVVNAWFRMGDQDRRSQDRRNSFLSNCEFYINEIQRMGSPYTPPGSPYPYNDGDAGWDPNLEGPSPYRGDPFYDVTKDSIQNAWAQMDAGIPADPRVRHKDPFVNSLTGSGMAYVPLDVEDDGQYGGVLLGDVPLLGDLDIPFGDGSLPDSPSLVRSPKRSRGSEK